MKSEGSGNSARRDASTKAQHKCFDKSSAQVLRQKLSTSASTLLSTSLWRGGWVTGRSTLTTKPLLRQLRKETIFQLWNRKLSHRLQLLIPAIQQYLNDGESLLRNLKGMGLDTSIQPAEVQLGIPTEIFIFKGWQNKDFGDRLNAEAPVMSVVEPTRSWEFSLKARGQYLFGVQFECKNGVCEWATTGGSKVDWKEVRVAYPESSGINPIIIRHGRNRFLHFPQINNYNLTLLADSAYRKMLKDEWKYNKAKKEQKIVDFLEIDGLISTTTDLYTTLVDSKTTLQYLKDRHNGFKNRSANSKREGK